MLPQSLDDLGVSRGRSPDRGVPIFFLGDVVEYPRCSIGVLLQILREALSLANTGDAVAPQPLESFAVLRARDG